MDRNMVKEDRNKVVTFEPLSVHSVGAFNDLIAMAFEQIEQIDVERQIGNHQVSWVSTASLRMTPGIGYP